MIKIYYFSDGAAPQYKSRNISSASAIMKIIFVPPLSGISLQLHIANLQLISLRQQLKGWQASLQNRYEKQIITSRKLHEWAVTSVPQ
jgi:hypothetical protein